MHRILFNNIMSNGKLYLLVAILILGPLSLHAQEQKLTDRHHIEFSVGEPFFVGLNLMFWNNRLEERAFYTWAGENRPYIDPENPREPGYEDGWFLPSFTLSYYYYVLKWLGIGGDLSTMSMCTTEKYFKNHSTYAYYLETNLYIAVGLRFDYYHKSVLDLYSGFTFGANIRFHTTETNPLLLTTSRFTWQLTFLGLRVGKKVYGTFDIGYGYKGFFSLGIGCRF